MHSDRRFVIEMLKAGAAGYLLKDGAFDELIHAIESVMARAAYLSPAITDMVVREYVAGSARRGQHSAFGVLTPREREVLQLLAEGLPPRPSPPASASASRPSRRTASRSWTSSTCTASRS